MLVIWLVFQLENLVLLESLSQPAAQMSLEIFYSQMRPYDGPKWGPETEQWFQEQQ